MAKSLKFVYAMILFIFLFLITKNVDGDILFHPFQIVFFICSLESFILFQ